MTTDAAAEPDDELARCRAELQAARCELDSFLYSVAHDLRAPLRSIAGFNQAIAEDCAANLDATTQGYLERIGENTNRLEQMLEGLLLLSRAGRSELNVQPVDLSELVRRNASALLSQEPQREVEFLISLGLQTCGDAALLQLVIEHLVGNAWKFTARRTQAIIEFGAVVKEGIEKPVYYLRDNGAGFNAKYSDRLFQVFQRLHAPTEFCGAGVGLALTRRIIERHGGAVWIEGATEQGATVYFTL